MELAYEQEKAEYLEGAALRRYVSADAGQDGVRVLSGHQEQYEV